MGADKTMISSGDARLRAAYAACARLAREHYENFPVASRLLPRPMRPHVAAVYAFARIADDIADEGTRVGRRSGSRLLDELRRLRLRPSAATPLTTCSWLCRTRSATMRSADLAVRGSAERVPAGRHGTPLCHVGRPARLLPPIGEPGRPARAAHRRLRRPSARSRVRCAVHGAPARRTSGRISNATG